MQQENQLFFFVNDTATTEIYTLSLHDALPISLVMILIAASIVSAISGNMESTFVIILVLIVNAVIGTIQHVKAQKSRSEEHTSELQSRQYLVCRLLLEKKHPQP